MAEKVSSWDELEKKSKADEPGWFEPGSKSEAATRGFANAATLGLGKYIQAPINAAISGDPKKSYWDNILASVRDEKAANQAAAEANPGSYIAGSAVAAIPQGVQMVRNVAGLSSLAGKAAGMGAQGAAVGGVQGALDAAPDESMLSAAGKGAAIQGGLSAAAPLIGAGLSKAGASLADRAAQAASKGTPKAPVDLGDGFSLLPNGKILNTAGQVVDNQGRVLNVPKALQNLPKASQRSVEEQATAVAQNVALPGIGASIGGYNAVSQGKDLGDVAQDVGLGLAGGYAVGKATSVANKVAGAVARGAGAAAPAVAKAIGGSGKAVSSTAGQATAQPFGRISEYLGSSNDERRKAAMQMQSSPEGRAATNEDSPARKVSSWEETED